ncbi:type I restriction endonuclease subunit R [Paenibacillus ehimensis]|uniref:type I restriction endonuclease subunit R n=1 Tax=Paenibacillus ehimensis TaxID=79264 RepID=UPI002DB9E21A|nr:type I restriction endonuclease subunit R [Paenibacillus ehimensis]MEC0209858.1 type I restriction endonuclease subunit R [Paenibacillus ehimensis]
MATIGEAERTAQNHVISLFRNQALLGYEYYGNRKPYENSNIETDKLTAFLRRQGYSDVLARRAVEELRKAAGNLQSGLYAANKAVYSLLKYGAKVRENPGEAEKTVFFIDWAHPSKNEFAVVEEVTVVENCEKRPDIVVYINGIAIAVIELKKSTISVANGIRQNLTNQHEYFIQPFFTTIQFTMAGNSSEGLRYGTVGTDEKNYLEWKNYAESRDNNSLDILETCKGLPDKLDWQLYSMFQKKRLLDFIHNFVIFDKGIKKLCRHNQFFGIKEAQLKIADGKGGIIWHTQGSGKTLTMVWLSKWILANDPEARVLIITDRDELDEQVEKTYIGVDEKIVRTKTCADLISKLDSYENRLICSLIHKFGNRSGEISDLDYDRYIEELFKTLPPNFSARGKFYVFVDECHRTQSGKLNQAMKAILPGAIFIGFTGTPLLKKNKKTSIEIFGGYIHTYKYDEGVADGVVLDLRYEARDIPQNITSQDRIDAWFETKTIALTPRAKAKLKSAWGNMQTLFSSRTRLESIARDIIFDMETKSRLMNGNGNAILVAESIYAACKYYEIFQSKGFKKCAIISSFVPREGDLRMDIVSTDEDTEAFEKYEIYKKMLGGQDVETFEKEAKRKFVEEPANMKLLIVVDKLLTGFDAPPCTYLYIDKTMHDHGLFQAICRVNRLDGEEKDFGYIVDYKQLFGDLTDALNKYTAGAFKGYDEEDVQGLIKDRLEEARKFFDKTLEELDDLCEGVALPRQEIDYIHYFCGENGVDINEDEAFARSREQLYRLVNRLVRAYTEIKPDMSAAGYTPSVQEELTKKVEFYIALKATIGQASADFIDLKLFEPGMRYLIDNYIIAEDSRKLGAFDDFTLLDFILTQEEKLKGDGGNKEGAAEAIENNIRKKVVEKILINPKYYERMSAILEQLIRERREGVIAYEQLLEKYIELAKNVTAPEENDAYPVRIRKSGALRAFYDNCGQDEELAIALHEAVLRSKQDRFRHNPIKEKRIKREIFKILKDESEVERVFNIICEQEEY